MGNAITENNMEQLGAKVGIIEAANGPTTPAAHKYLTLVRKLIIAPDIMANGVGVDCSIEEINANVSGIVPDMDKLKKELTNSSERVVKEVLATANQLQTHDLRVAAAGLSMAYLLQPSQPNILRELVSA
jgi:glutamate dehydrogenase/leucine dehydrogenase